MDKEQLRQIFIEEAEEIIEKLDVQIINFEEDPANKELLNDLFRGVHTLKGSATSFGFVKLGKYVHHFEDLLDYHRNSADEILSERIDLFLKAVDALKGIFNHEIEGKEGFPGNYKESLSNIQNALNDEKDSYDISAMEKLAPVDDIASEFIESAVIESEPANEKTNSFLNTLEADEKLCHIELSLDNDIYFRGYDHTSFFMLLSQMGRILESFWDLENIPMLDEFDSETSYIGKVDIYFAFKNSVEELIEIFNFVDEDEFSIKVIEAERSKIFKTPAISKTVIDAEPNIETENESKPVSVDDSEKEVPVLQSEKKSFIKIETSKLNDLFDSVGELVIAQNFLNENEVVKNLNDENVEKTMEILFKITKLIQKRVMGLRMVPMRDVFDRMKRVVRDVSKKVDKEIEFKTFGEDTEIDKTMIDKLSDPLIHLVRNAIDHGIETTSIQRINAGKDPTGTVTLGAYHRGGNVVIEISDNGRGMDKDIILEKAIKHGLVKKDHSELSEQQIFGCIMQAGFSTAAAISDISGRGVGLDVVREFIENMGGKIEIESKPADGSVFKMILPLTLAIIDGMLVKSSNETFIIPTLSIVESFRPARDISYTVHGKGEFVTLRENLLPIIRLNKRLELSSAMPEVSESILVCVENREGKFAILVDDLIGRQQVVIKTLGKSMSKLKEISGGAVLGNGEVALILNVEGITV